MTISISPLPKQQFNQNGAPVAFGKLFTYIAGTSTKQLTYSNVGGTHNTNPIILDANGQCDIWLDDSIAYKFVLSPSTDTDPPTNPYWTEDNITSTNYNSASFITSIEASTGSSLVGYSAGGAGASSRTVQEKLHEIQVSVTDYGAVLDGVTDDYLSLTRAEAALPATGGTIVIPDSASGMYIGTEYAPSKPVRIVARNITITGPHSGFIFNLGTNGSSFHGAGRGATILKLNTPANAVTVPTAHTTISAGAVNAIVIDTIGSHLYSTPITTISASPTQDDAALIATVSGGVLSNLLSVANGSGYVSAPTVGFIGGGAGAIKCNEIMRTEISGFSVDMSSIANATGVYHYGGWYNDFHDIEIISTSVGTNAIGFVVDSHTLGVPGPTGSYGGAYVSDYKNIYTNIFFVVGHDTSTATTFHFDTVDCSEFAIHGSVSMTMTNPVVQTNSGYFFDLVNVDGLTVSGGDVEGSATLIRSRGTCSNIRFYGTLAYSLSGSTKYGPIGPGWDINLSKSNSTTPPLRTGSGGNAGQSFQNTGWTVQSHLAIQYSGDTLVMSNNIVLTDATHGNLDDVSNNGFALIMTASGSLIMRYATAGANPRTLTDIAQFDSTGLKMTNLPSASPGAGTKQFWYDPADGNRVKFAV